MVYFYDQESQADKFHQWTYSKCKYTLGELQSVNVSWKNVEYNYHFYHKAVSVLFFGSNYPYTTS